MTADTPTPDARGWPDADRPGVPLNAERNGWHILGYPDGGWGAFAWDAKRCTWWVVDQEAPPACIHACYLGPCLTPAEVDAAVQAEREACAAICQQWSDETRRKWGGNTASSHDTEACADAIRARGTTDAGDTK